MKFRNTMSELPQSRRMEERSEQVLALGLALGGGRLSRDSEIVHNHTKQIASLRREIEEKDEAISRFNKDLKDLREQNDELKITVESKDEEIKALKEKINKLESEKKTLETKLEAVRKEVDELKERNVTMEMEVKALKKEVKNLREEVQDRRSSVSERMPLPFQFDHAVEKASLVLGQLCWRIQAMMYKNVLPSSYDDRTSYKVKHIEEDIEELEDDQQKVEAKKRWATLKKKLNWKKLQHTRAMKSIQGARNDTAHPDLDEQLLIASATLMEQEGKLTGHHSAARVNELIEMWKKLVQLQ